MDSEQYLNPDPAGAFLQIETTNRCNHACIFCPNSRLTAPHRIIDRELAMRLIGEAYEMGVRRGAFFLFGEPLLCPDIFDYYRYAADLGYRQLVFVTNLAVANEETVRRIFASGVTDLKVSVNGGRETYEKIHGSDDYEKVMGLLDYAWRYKTGNRIPSRLLSSYVLTKDNMGEYREHARRIRSRVDFFATTALLDFAGSMRQVSDELRADIPREDRPFLFDVIPSLPCAELSSRICVTVDGFLTLCCHEPFGRARVCDLHLHPLGEAWLSEPMRKLRKLHLEGDVQGLVCRDCVHPSQPLL